MSTNRFVRAIGAIALGAMFATTGCGGNAGGGGSIVPKTPTGGSPNAMLQGRATLTLPDHTSPQPQAHRTGAKREYINTSDPNSSILVSVTPADPAEAAQWQALYGTQGFTLCFTIYQNGAIFTGNPNVVVTAGPPTTVSFPMPAPPGNDTFTFYQYDGVCNPSNPYVAPTPGPNANGTGILAQSTPLTVNFTAGQSNNFNVSLTTCSPPSATPPTCSNATPPPGTPPTVVTVAAAVSAVYLAGSSPAPKALAAPIPLPVKGPVREQRAFITGAGKVGVPIPLVGLDSAGYSIGYAGPPAATVVSSGVLPKVGDVLKVAHTETGPSGTVTGHATLYLVDAKTGAVAQNDGGGTINITQLNAFDTATAAGAAGVAVGDPYVLVLAYDGSAATQVTSMTVTLTGTFNGAALTSQSVAVAPQSALYSATGGAAPANGYADVGGPYAAAADILNTFGSTLIATSQGLWVTDGGSIALDGINRFAVTGAASLTGETLDTNGSLTNAQILAVDNSQAAATGLAAPANGGVFGFDPVAHTSKPFAIQNLTTGNFVSYGAPQGIAYVSGGYVYVIAGGKIYAIDPQSSGAGGFATTGGGAFFLAEQIGTLPLAGYTAPTASGVDVVASGTKLYFPDGAKHIVSIDTATCVPNGANCTPTVFATSPGANFTGFSANGSSYLASDSAGQLYTISATGTVASLGLTGGGSADGPVGVLGTSPLAPTSYALQGNTTNFFGSASVPTLPYTLAPFSAAGPVFAPAAQAAIAGGALSLKADTSNATATGTGKTKAAFGIAFVPANKTGANQALTADSYVFADNGNIRTLVP